MSQYAAEAIEAQAAAEERLMVVVHLRARAEQQWEPGLKLLLTMVAQEIEDGLHETALAPQSSNEGLWRD